MSNCSEEQFQQKHWIIMCSCNASIYFSHKPHITCYLIYLRGTFYFSSIIPLFELLSLLMTFWHPLYRLCILIWLYLLVGGSDQESWSSWVENNIFKGMLKVNILSFKALVFSFLWLLLHYSSLDSLLTINHSLYYYHVRFKYHYQNWTMLSKKSNTFLSDYCIDSGKYSYLEIKMYCPPP